eukprot:gnl/Chilomastix_cuspidata/2531.p1 GENE.gnl/Chilomastix_cuspidata/2531~~gnl/Chilomastix_cuspidata/2531.p1  ORF type:complete len:591 (+),score=2.62 gnl/Chilomastix_cuspidata/2531:2496-4268(+)
MHNVQISILSASDVPIADVKTSDPYVKLFQCFDSKHIQIAQTHIIKKNLQPTWNETFKLCGLRGMVFLFELYDHDRVGADDFLGKASFSITSPFISITEEMVLRLDVAKKYARQYSDGRQCQLSIQIKFVPPSPSFLAEFDRRMREATLGPGQTTSVKFSRKTRLYGYFEFEVDGEDDSLAPFRRPYRPKDRTRTAVVVPSDWIEPDAKSVRTGPAVELNWAAFGKRGNIVSVCYAGQPHTRGVQHSGTTPLLTPNGQYVQGFHIRPRMLSGKTLSSIAAHAVSVFLRFPQEEWRPFHNMKFVLVDAGDSEGTKKTGFASCELPDVAQVIAVIPFVPMTVCSGGVLAQLSVARSTLTVEALTAEAQPGSVSWTPRSCKEILPEITKPMFGPLKVTRGVLPYPRVPIDIAGALQMAGVEEISDFQVGLGWDTLTDLDASIIAFQRDVSCAGFCYFGNRFLFDGALVHHGDNLTGVGSGDDETITVRLTHIPENVSFLAVTITSFGGRDFISVKGAFARILVAEREIFRVNLTKSRPKTGLVLCYFFRVLNGAGQWSLIQTSHFCIGRTAAQIQPDVAAHIQQLRSAGTLPL